MINCVIFTGDFLRPVEMDVKANKLLPEFRPAQTENILWFYRLFRRHVAEATGLPVKIMSWNNGIDTPLIYRMLGVEMDTSGWVEAFSTDEFPVDLLYLFEDIFENSLVVAFEMADSVKHVLTYLGIPFIDFNVHPIRFLPDVFFAVQTNSLAVFEMMKPYHLPSNSYFSWADLLSATAVKLPHPVLPPNSTLLIGQMSVDRSLIIDARLRNLASYADELPAVVGRQRTVLFKPHPYNPTAFGLFESSLTFNRIRWTSANVYTLMASQELHEIVGITSSVLLEAKYFDKLATALAPPPFDIPDEAVLAQPGQHLSIYDDCFDADFWRAILSPLVSTTPPTGQRFRRPPNTLRVSLRNFWGFNEVSTDFLIQVYEAGKSLK